MLDPSFPRFHVKQVGRTVSFIHHSCSFVKINTNGTWRLPSWKSPIRHCLFRICMDCIIGLSAGNLPARCELHGASFATCPHGVALYVSLSTCSYCWAMCQYIFDSFYNKKTHNHRVTFLTCSIATQTVFESITLGLTCIITFSYP